MILTGRLSASYVRDGVESEEMAAILVVRFRPARPLGYVHQWLPDLAPSSAALHSPHWARLYRNQLKRTNQEKAEEMIAEMAGELTPLLLCFEKVTAAEVTCHRTILGEWLGGAVEMDTLGRLF